MAEPYLIADIGGTNTRFALACEGAVLWPTLLAYPTADFDSLEAAATLYLTPQRARVSEACIALAGPLRDGSIALTNGSWYTERDALKTAMGWDRLTVLNDFAALALGLPQFDANQLTQIGGGSPVAGPCVVLGPGTGFGAAVLVESSAGPLVLPSEAGHAALGAADADELELFDWLLRELGTEHGAAYRELLWSGSGLELLERGWSALRGWRQPPRTAPQIVADALAEEPRAGFVLDGFCALLGATARDLALTFGARGGVYIAGGIVRRFVPFLRRSRFRERFESSAKLRDYLAPIPTWVITESGAGLIGAAAAHRANGDLSAPRPAPG